MRPAGAIGAGARSTRRRHAALSAGLLGAVLALGIAAGCGSTSTVTVTETVTRTVTETTTVQTPSAAAACSGDDLTGSFSEVPGSAGAGSITYELTLTNTSRGDCFVAGLPELQLLDADGQALPTTAVAAQPERSASTKVVLFPGRAARADARFSPDIPGPDEPATEPEPGEPRSCQPVARELRVTVGGRSVTVAVEPPTPVCSAGAIRMSPFVAA